MFIELTEMTGTKIFINTKTIKCVFQAINSPMNPDANSGIEWVHSSDEFRNRTDFYLESYQQVVELIKEAENERD